MNAAELRAEIERQRPAPVAELVERDPAVIEATRTHRTLAGQVQALQGRANEAHREAQAWRETHPIRAKAHDTGVMRAAYLDERAQVIEQARAEYQKVAPQATRAREVAESVRNATTTRIAQEQAPALARIRALEQRAAELERIERERQAQALREQQAEGEARLLVRDMREMADSLRCGAPGWTEDGHQLLALARAEGDAGSTGRMRAFDLYRLGDAAARDWAARAIERDIDLGFELEHVDVQGDEVMLRELLGNLIDNAIRYSPPGSTVTVRCGTQGSRPFLAVEDDGPGVPESARPRIFERFFRVEGSPGDGSGLGLAIVREVAERHGASVELGTPPSGRGTAVVVRFGTRSAG